MLLLLACAAEVPSATPPPAPAGAPQVDTLLGKAPGVVFTGVWTNKDCPGRNYPRNLYIDEEGEYAGLDLVSPCPKGTACMWSGMVGFAGTWRQDGDRLVFREIGAPGQKGSPHPTEVRADFSGHLVENDCLYDKGLTVPDGYTEDEVKPRLPGR